MLSKDLMGHILASYPDMTKAEKKVADFVMASPQKALNATITSLAKYCDIGETSVFRFCRTLEFNGYQEFRIALALSLSDSAVSIGQETGRINESASLAEVADRVLGAYESALQKTHASLNLKAVDTAVRLLMGADFIYLFGAGGSAVSALEMQIKFSRIMPNICFDIDMHQQLIKASLLGPGYAAVIFSNSGITRDAIRIAQTCHERQAKVIFITGFVQTPAHTCCDVVLFSGGSEGPLEGGSITAKTSQLFMIDLLYGEVNRLMKQKALDNKKLTSEIIADKML